MEQTPALLEQARSLCRIIGCHNKRALGESKKRNGKPRLRLTATAALSLCGRQLELLDLRLAGPVEPSGVRSDPAEDARDHATGALREGGRDARSAA